MKAKRDLDWLKPHAKYPLPFVIRAKGQRWATVTDGFSFIAIRLRSEEAKDWDEVRGPRVQTIIDLISKAHKRTTRGTLGGLRSLAEMTLAGLAGVRRAKAAIGVQGVYVNAERLSKLLDVGLGRADLKVQVRGYPHGCGDMLVIIGSGWRAVLMGVEA